MKAFKLYLPIVLLLTVVSCKKKDEVAPDEARIELTKYFITWEVPTSFSGGRTYNLPGLIFFENNQQATVNEFSSGSPGLMSYKLEDDKIKITSENSSLVFTLKNENITETSGFNHEIKNVKLHRIPTTNQFVGKYGGMLTSWLVNTAIPFKYVFNQTQFGEEMVADPTLDYTINPIKNVYARSFIDNVLRHFLIVDGKLIVVRYKIGGTNAESFLCGNLSKDQ